MCPALVHYAVGMQDLHTHLFSVTLTIAKPAANQVVSLPVWIPGSYMVREFSKNLQRLVAQQNQQLIQPTQLDKCTWQVNCLPDLPLVLNYEIYAFDNSVRTAWLDASRGFFNGTSLFLKVAGLEDRPHELALRPSPATAHWQVATGLAPKSIEPNGFGCYQATNYDELVDCPVEMGSFWRGSFEAGGICHQMVVTGASPGFDGTRLLADTRTICEAEIRFWHGDQAGHPGHQPPHATYLFMLNAVHNGYGGLEHRNSTALICKRADLPQWPHATLGFGAAQPNTPSEGYATLLGLISHEYFHTWNVKHLRPKEFARYHYNSENYTELLWFFEGFTSYYDDLLLRRAGLLDDARYLDLLAKTINSVLQTPGRAVQSVAQASLDAWIKYYRQDENTANATVSYYTKGALVALCLDLSLRQSAKTTLDDVMRALWQRCQGGPMTEADVAAVLQTLSGRSYAGEIANWVHGTCDLPLKALLEAQGIRYDTQSASRPDQLGLRVNEQNGLTIKSVLRGSLAEQAGFAAGDEWLGIETGQGAAQQGWRLNRLDDLALYVGAATHCLALIARDQRLLKLSLNLPNTVQNVLLTVADPQRVSLWLGGQPHH